MKPGPWFLATLVAALTVSLGGLMWWQVERSHELMRRQVLAQAEQRSLQLADAMAGQVGGLLSSIDLALQQLRQEWDGDARHFDAKARAILGALPPGAVTHVTVVGADGYVVYNSLNNLQRTYVGDREHFKTHFAGADRLVIGKPVMSRLNNTWTFIVNRPILHHGRFAGTVNMSVSSEYMSDKLAGLQLSGKDIIGLFLADGSFMARSNDFLQAMGKSIPANRPFLSPGAPARGVYYLPGVFDQAPRIYAWRRLDEYGLITAIGLAEDTVLAPLAAGMARDRAASIGLVSLAAAFGGVIVLLLLRAARKQGEIAASEALYRGVIEASFDGFWKVDTNGHLLQVNDAYVRRSGYSREELLGMHIADLDAQMDAAAIEKRSGEFIARGNGLFETWHRARDGTLWPVEVSVVFVQQGEGVFCSFLRDISERKLAEEKSRASEASLREAQRIAKMGSWKFDVQTGDLTWSEEVYRIHEIDPARFTPSYEAFLGRIHPADRERVNAAYLASVEHGTPYEIVYRIILPDERIKYLRVKGETEYCDGRPVHTMGMVLDITESTLAESALRQKESLLAEAQQVAHLGNWNLDLTSGKATWSDEEYRLLGYDPGSVEPGSESFMQAVHPDDRDTVWGAMQRAMDPLNDVSYYIEHRVVVPGGERILEERGCVIFDEEGQATRMYGTTMDITDRKRAEEALRASEIRFRSLAANVPGAIFRYVLHADGSDQIEYMSPGCEAIWELVAADIQENPARLWQMIDPAERSSLQDSILESARSLLPWSHVWRITSPSGKTKWLQGLGQPERLSNGDTLWNSLILDITEQEMAEEALRQLNEELENRVEQRTAELAASRDEAERSSRAKSEFLSRMSHELRTPLNAILGFGQLLELDLRQGEQADNVREILHAGRHLLELINEVLDLARIEAGRLTLSQEPVPLMPLVEDCLTMIRPLAEARGIRIVEAGRDCGEHVRADRVRLKQVLLNLLSNAVKYNRERGMLGIACVHQGDAIQVRISDSGAGLSDEQQSRLFTAFERLDEDKGAVEGTGIGLALSKRLMELMRGEIGVESVPGRGSTFWVRLPATDGHPEPAHGGDRELAPEAASTVIRQRQDVLCIEDNPANLRLIERILARRSDVRLLTAGAPGLGLELAQAHRPALILLDINLPDMDGYEVMKCLRENPATRDIPVVAVSANAMPADLARGKAAGFADYLTKPLDLDRLLAAVDRALAAEAEARDKPC